MLIYPAMDLMDGRCVRLAQGRFEEATVYSADPAAALTAFAAVGAAWAHVVDLDGARARSPRQHALIERLAPGAGLHLQVAGGFRTRDQVARMLDAGVARVVIGSLAVQDPDATAGLLSEFGADRITLAFDVRVVGGVPEVATSGWVEGSGKSLWDALAAFQDARNVLATDIDRDGMMRGPNVPLMTDVARRFPSIAVQASGGVAALDDLAALRATGAAGAIVGKAIWEAKIDLAEAIDAGR